MKHEIPPLNIYSETIARYPDLATWLASLPSRKKTVIVIDVLLAHIKREKRRKEKQNG